jgi:hypothetical protein
VSWEFGSLEQSLAQALTELIQSSALLQTLVEQSPEAEFHVHPALHWHFVTSEAESWLFEFSTPWQFLMQAFEVEFQIKLTLQRHWFVFDESKTF